MLIYLSYSSGSLLSLFSPLCSPPPPIDPFSTYIFITVFILPWNCRGAYCNYEELLQLLRNHDPAFICLQELILSSCFLPTPGGYISFISAIRGPHEWGGEGILLHHSVSGALAVRIHLRRVYTVCSLCLAPAMPIARDDLIELLH